MSYYEDIKSRNIISAIKDLLRAKSVSLRDSDSKVEVNVTTGWDTPWRFIKQSYGTDCNLWKNIIFDHIVAKNIPKDKWFVPIGCMDCFKVVVRPQTLKQLFALEELQKRLDRPSKCGIEIRPHVFGNYGGYFYNRGLEKGLQCYKIVRKAVNEDELLGPDIPIILKRACTEMEHGVGPSNKWEVTSEQLELELLIKEKFVNDSKVIPQAEHCIDHVHQLWIEKAYEWGDTTVMEYLDDKPLYPTLVTYHHLAEEKKEPEKKKTKLKTI